VIARCLCEADAAGSIAREIYKAEPAGTREFEIEFREVPYFIVSRSKQQWMEARGDINCVRVVGATALGILIDPAAGVPGERTFVPWTNVLSMTMRPPAA